MEIHKSTGVCLLKVLWYLLHYPIFPGGMCKSITACCVLPSATSSFPNRFVEKPLKRETNVTKVVGQQLSPLALCVLKVDQRNKQKDGVGVRPPV